ncbi:MAG: DUF1697 domain-containing protein [Flavobacteriales bacterium]|nr:DUF1697 domain-containing protein [Flavobacteriales bacterium]MCB9448453.1 DUF1697 domain-containing protein [Flavobacteriales bacterium]
MPTYISILRGINVSGKNKIKMADLKSCYEKLGLDAVTTYIQSGNVVFRATKTTSGKLENMLTGGIHKTFGMDVPVIVRTPDEIQRVIKGNPFLPDKEIDTARLYVTFLQSLPASERLALLEDFSSPPDEFRIIGHEVYMHCPVSYGNSKLSNTFFENKLKVPATTRNWKTVNELMKMAEAIG